MKTEQSTRRRIKNLKQSRLRKMRKHTMNAEDIHSKRRRREPPQKVQTESFIMKLFDRSLDLSKYTEKTPLYPIIRAWISNQPRSSNIINYRERCQPEPTRRENNGAELMRRIQRGEYFNLKINAMPAPLNVEVPKLERIIPKADLIALDKALELDNEPPDAVEKNAESDPEVKKKAEFDPEAKKKELLANHKSQWKQIKKKCIVQSQSRSKRYELNQLIIKKLFKP